MKTGNELLNISPCEQLIRLTIVPAVLLVASLCAAQTTAIGSEKSDKVVASDRVRLSEILMSTPRPDDPVQVAEAKRTAAKIREAIRSGDDFADIARKYSHGPSARLGGDLGYFGHGSLAPSLENVVFQMKVGDVSDVIRTKQGFVILKVTDRKAEGTRPQSSLEILGLKANPEFKSYLEALKKQINQRWYNLIPKSAQARHGSVAIEFSVGRDGGVLTRAISSSSGDLDLDQAALNAVGSAGPYPPLPRSVEPNALRLLFHFEYNPGAVLE